MCNGCSASCKAVRNRKNPFKIGKNLLYLAMLGVLVFAWCYGRLTAIPDYEALLQNELKGKKVERTEKRGFFRIVGEEGFEGYVTLSEGSGYGGPFTMGTWVGPDSLIRNVYVLENRETPSFFKKLQDRSFFCQFKGKKLDNSFKGNEDVDWITGATVSSRAFTKSIQKASYQMGEEKFGMVIAKVDERIEFGWQEIVVLLLVLMAIGASYRPGKRIRMVILLTSLVFLGFAFNAALSVSGFSALALGFFPSVKDHLAWWILIVGSLGAVVFLTRNIYCTYLCPFHAIEVLLNKISGINLKLSPKVLKVAQKTSLFLLWVSLVLIFMSANPTRASYEPFAMIFSLEGVGWQWYILPATLLGAFFIKDFFCKFFCPVGQTFTLLIKWKQKVMKR